MRLRVPHSWYISSYCENHATYKKCEIKSHINWDMNTQTKFYIPCHFMFTCTSHIFINNPKQICTPGVKILDALFITEPNISPSYSLRPLQPSKVSPHMIKQKQK